MDERFWSKVNKESSCWAWTGWRYKSGYGGYNAKVDGQRRCRTVKASRYAYEQLHGPIQDGLFVLHRCDNPPCVNPDHLFLGTHQENMDDMYSKSRANKASGDRNGTRTHPESYPRGELSPRSKLTAVQVCDIRRRYAAGETQRLIAKEYGVCRSSVGLIVTRVNWAHIP